nr:nonstructural protein nsp1ab [Caprine astrovirus]
MSFFVNRVDEAIASGDANQIKARFDAREWFGELRRLRSTVPWYITYQPRMFFYPTTRPDRVLTASTVIGDEWRTFVCEKFGCKHILVEVNCIPDHQPTILTAALIEDRDRVKREYADLCLQHELLRAELAQHRKEYAQTYRVRFSWSTIFALVFLGFSLCWHGSQAFETTTTTRTTMAVDPSAMLKLNVWLDEFIANAKKTIHTHHTTVINIARASPTWILVNAVMPYSWSLISILLGVISVYKAEHKVLSILFLCAATLSGGDWVFITTASYQTIVSAIIQVLCVLVSHFDPLGAMCLSTVALFVTFLASMCLPSTDFVHHVRAASINTVVLIVSILLRTLALPAMPLAIALALVRAYHTLTTVSGATVEIRSEDGKVVSKEPVRPGILFKFKQAFSKLRQVRSTMPPLVRVNPSAVVRVETPEGVGTGFLCANYIVTAGHVVGSNKVVSACVGQAKYQTQVVRHVTGKDIALLKIPQQLQAYPRLKLASKIDVAWVCVYSPDADGAIIQSVVPGHQVDECIDYAVPTRDGMSGAPLVNPDGRVMAVHLTNTGFTGGAQIITQADVIDPPKTTAIEDKLRAELEELKKQLNKCSQSTTNEQEIVNLVRAAIGREMTILRSEINKELGFQQAKGKTKHKLRARLAGATKRKQRGPMFTEEEYQRLLERGLTTDEIRDMVDQIYDKEVAGFPDWEVMDDGYDPDEDWVFETDTRFGQRNVKVPAFNQYLDRDYESADVEEMLKSLTLADIAAIGPLYPIVQRSAGTALCPAVLCMVDRYAALNGLSLPTSGMSYSQRKVPPKNRPAGPASPGPKIHELDAWYAFREPPERYVVPNEYPVVCNLPINRPVYDDKIVDDPLLGLLPPCEPNLPYGPAVWGPEAYTKSFEKFDYAKPSRFWEDHPDECRFADLQWRKHYNFLDGSRVIHITATDKNMDSTPGYPKCELHDSERDYLERHGWGPYIREFSRVDAGECPKVLWYCFLKKEQLKKEKILDGDIRQIVCPDAIYSRIGAALEQHQNSLMKKHTADSSGQCGWTPFYGGFERTMRRLDKNHVVEFDWTRFDGTIPRELLRHIKNLRWEKMDPSHRERYRHVHKWYVDNLLTRYVLMPTGEVTIQRRGNPSGQISTTMDNNMVNYWLQAFEFAYLHRGKDIHALWREYDTVVYGDDRLNTTPVLPENYIERVVSMYRDIFGMWVKPDKVKIHDGVVGASFCGFTVGNHYQPIPTNPEKLWASLVTPCQKLPDDVALCGKLLSFKILMHNSEDHPFKEYVEKCLAAIGPSVGIPKFTDEQLDYLWRGGPKNIPNG